MSETLAADDADALERALVVLRDGRLVVVPTDTVYAVIADAFAPQATRRLLRARGSGRNRPLPVLIGDTRQLSGLSGEVPESAERLVAEHWPGPLTLVLRAVPGLGWDLGNSAGTVAVRMPDEAFLRELIGELGPIAGTGATRRGRDAATTKDEAEAALGEAVSLYIDGGTRDGQRSTIVDASRGEGLTVLREGALRASVVVPAEAAEGGEDAPGPAGDEVDPGGSEDDPEDGGEQAEAGSSSEAPPGGTAGADEEPR